MANRIPKSTRRSTAQHSAIRPPRLHGAEAARPAHLREANCRLLLRLLRQRNPCSKAELVRESGLSATTVSVSVSHLRTLGLVTIAGDGESSGGRPPSLIHLNRRRGLVAGADVGGTRLRMVLADLNGTAVSHWATRLSADQKTPEAVVALMQMGLRAMAQQSGLRLRVLHLTVGAPGITDVDRGVVLAAPNLEGWTHCPLAALVKRTMRIPCTVENDVNLAAVGEHAAGQAQDAQNFLFIAMGTGVGAGIFLRGSLYHGVGWSAGEIGYLPVQGLPREQVRLQASGQLERTIGGTGIEARWRTALRHSNVHTEQNLHRLHASEIFDLAAGGNPLAMEVTTVTARLLADAIVTLSLLFNPEVVVLGGGVGAHRTLRAATETFLHENELAHPVLLMSSLGTEAQLSGAIALSLSAVEAYLLC